MKHKAYILRTCDHDMKSYGGFQWPMSGIVKAPDWRADVKCGRGLHGFLWGEGYGDLANWSENAKWVVAGISEWIDLDGKVKFPEAEVVFVGSRYDATNFIRELGARGAVIGSTVTGGNCSTVTGGYSSTVTGGVGSTVTGGDRSTVTGGVNSIMQVKWHDGNRYRIAVAYVGEDGIEPNVPYRVENGKFVKVN